MTINSKKVVGVVVGLAVIGVTIYAIKKYYDEKKQSEESIGVDEAREIVEEGRNALNLNQIKDDDMVYVDAHVHHKVREMGLTDDDMEDIKDKSSAKAYYHHSKNKHVLNDDDMDGLKFDARDQAYYDPGTVKKSDQGSVGPIGIKPEDIAASREVVDEDVDTVEWFEGPDPQEIQDSKGHFEEEGAIDDLRYPPDSMDAREQFINMELANLGKDNDTRDIIAMLYDHPFRPICDEDNNLKIRLMDHRIKFFGEQSRWISEVSYGDVIMYYGKSAGYNCGETVRYWIDYFLTCADINDITLTSDELDERITRLNKHVFFNEELNSHGLFGLNSFQMTEAIRISKTRIDECVTYDIEFHKFIEGVVQ